MVVVSLPGKEVDYVGLVGLMRGGTGSLPLPDGPLVIRVADETFITASALTWLCAFCVGWRQKGMPVRFEGTKRGLRYLARMNLLKHAGMNYQESFERHAEAGRFMALRLVETQEDVLAAVHALCDLVAHHFDNAREFLPALEWAAYEIIDNVFNHAQSPTPAVVYAQYYPNQHRLRLAIADQGRGLRASLSERFELFGHGDAVDKALQKGVTRSPHDHSGNGMAGTLAISEANGGSMRVATGDVQFEKRAGKKHRFHKCNLVVPGTTVELSLDTDSPVALQDTFIGDSLSTYLQSLSSQVEAGRPIVVREEVVHTGGREPARALRHRLEVLLDDPFAVITLDFTGVNSASSSFLDELLGRLCVRYGRNGLRGRLTVRGAGEELMRIANGVTEQRLQSPPPG